MEQKKLCGGCSGVKEQKDSRFNERIDCMMGLQR